MKKKIFAVIVLFVLVTQSWFAYLMIKYPYIGVNVQLKDGQWVITTLDTDSGSKYLDVRLGDIVLSIDGLLPEEHSTIRKWDAVEQVNSFVVQRGEEIHTLSTSHIANAVQLDIVTLFYEVICFTIAILLYNRVSYSKSAIYLALVFYNIGITFMGISASVRGDVLGKLLVTNSLLLIPIVFLNFLIVFFKERKLVSISEKPIPYLYFVTLLGFTAELIICYFNDSIAKNTYAIMRNSSLILFLGGILVNFGILTKLYFKHRNTLSDESTVLRSVWIALFVSFFPIIFLSFIPKILFDEEFIFSIYTGFFVLFFPLTFAYLIVSKKLYDIDFIFRRMLFTVIASLLPSVLIVAVVLAIFNSSVFHKQTLFMFAAIVIILSFVLYSIEHMYTRLERFMFPRKHTLQAALKRISKDLTSTSSFRELKDLILLDIVNTLQVYGGAIVFKYRDSTEVISEGEIDRAKIEKTIGLDQAGEHSELMFFEITNHEEYTSFLVMTRKKSNTRLGLEEVQWLNLIISYLAVSLENVYLIRKLTDKLNSLASHLPGEQGASDFNWFRKLSFELQERERVRIATDLHDTTMQDLFFLKRKLKALGEKHTLSSEVNDGIQSLIEYIEIINVNLRQNCFDLHPYLLQEIGLVRTIEKIVERESYSCPFQIRFDAVGVQMIERKDLEFKRHLFRIVQELLNNAKKHSEATLVSIRLTASMGYYVLHYRDDGVGFDPSKLAAPDIGTPGVGMEQLRSRILHMGGHLELAAAQGSGVDIRISFPMKEGLIA
ncbi:hypothetical protein D7M11_19070 [Paenibacillus ginsengarvi]|uniref:histidine kinase n=1 Tax=Paenibacillus ginsengarvi TaxID=400777 RepID=A0A3B0C7P5_9BACL|nr:hypothetical protein D7M11_19070 [Paenibacillus ginsengarvi]